jgi:hypothetical protein
MLPQLCRSSVEASSGKCELQQEKYQYTVAVVALLALMSKMYHAQAKQADAHLRDDDLGAVLLGSSYCSTGTNRDSISNARLKGINTGTVVSQLDTAPGQGASSIHRGKHALTRGQSLC